MPRATCLTAGCGRPVHANGICNRCTLRARRGTVVLSPEERFWHLVHPAGPPASLRPELGACWLWRRGGRALFRWQGAAREAHRVAWAIAWGALPPARVRLEQFACATPGCVNPAHWRLRGGIADAAGRRNVLEWNATHDRCAAGHLFSAPNTVSVAGGRLCRACRREAEQRRPTRRRAAGCR